MHFIGVFNKDGGTFRAMDMPGFMAEAEAIFTAPRPGCGTILAGRHHCG